jgi:hypothetical protein
MLAVMLNRLQEGEQTQRGFCRVWHAGQLHLCSVKHAWPPNDTVNDQNLFECGGQPQKPQCLTNALSPDNHFALRFQLFQTNTLYSTFSGVCVVCTHTHVHLISTTQASYLRSPRLRAAPAAG